MAEKLKPCPFCGGEAELVRNSSGSYFVRCTDRQCAARTRLFHENENGARASWNRRAERTCSFPVTKDEEEIARRDASAAPGTFVTQDVPLCRKCTSCGNKFKPWAEAPKWLRYCPQCGARVVSK